MKELEVGSNFENGLVKDFSSLNLLKLVQWFRRRLLDTNIEKLTTNDGRRTCGDVKSLHDHLNKVS